VIHEQLREELQAIATAVAKLEDSSQEGLERELRARLRDWLMEEGWDPGQIFVGERIDVRLDDSQGLPAVYIETKDPRVGISPAEVGKALERARSLPGLRAVVLTSGFDWVGYTPGAAKPFFDATVTDPAADFRPLTEILDPARYALFSPSATTLDVRDPVARQLLVEQLSRLTGLLGDDLTRMLRDVLGGAIPVPVVESLFSDWLLFSYGLTLASLVNLVQGSTKLPARRPQPAQRAAAIREHFPDVSAVVAEERIFEVDATAAADRAQKARDVTVSLLQDASLLRLFAEQSALVVFARLLFCRIWQQTADQKSLPSPAVIAERGAQGGRAARALYAEVRRELAGLDEHLYGLSLYDWWLVEDTTREGLKRPQQEKLRADETDTGAHLLAAWQVVYRFDLSSGTPDVFRDVYERLLPPETRFRLGGFYTHESLVRLILELVEYDGTGALLDPSCGSGTFLVEALTIRTAGRKGSRSPAKALEQLEQDARAVCGIDIHPFAVLLTQLNMLLNSIDLVGKAARIGHLPGWAYEGNTLLDATEELEEQHDLLNESVRNGRVKATIHRRKETDAVRQRPFDYVVGNPPWGGVLRAGGPLSGRRYESYRTLAGKSDIYAAFMEWASRRLSRGGKFGFVTQNRYLSRAYGRSVQQLLTGDLDVELAVRLVIDLGEIGGRLFFPGETNYPCITVAERVDNKASIDAEPVTLVRVNPGDGRELPTVDELLDALRACLTEVGAFPEKTVEALLAGATIVACRVPIASLKAATAELGRWPIPLPTPRAKGAAARGTALAEVFDILQGATPGGAGDFDLKSVVVMARAEAKGLGLEAATIVPVVGGRDIPGGLLARPEQVAIYPYTATGGLLDLGLTLTGPDNKEASRQLNRLVAAGKVEYPQTARFLVARYRELRSREFEGRGVGREWYRWHRPREPRLLLAKPKIIVRRSFKSDAAAVDVHGILPLDSCWAVVPKVGEDRWKDYRANLEKLMSRKLHDRDILLAIAAEIESALLQTLQAADTPLQGRYLSVRATDLRRLPIVTDRIVDRLR
jgi:hypothetical protein